MVVTKRFQLTFSLFFTSFFLTVSGTLSAAQSPGCWFWPPGGVYRSGLNQVAATPPYAEASDADAVAWLDDERVAIGYTGYNTGFPKNGQIRMYKPLSTKFEYQGAIRPPDDAYPLSRFGRQIATSGKFIASRYVLSDISGVVAVYEDPAGDGNWVLRSSLRADNPREDDEFGMALAMQGEWLCVIDQGLSGGIYMFKRNSQGAWERNDMLALPGYNLGNIPVDDLFPVLKPGLLAIGQPLGVTGFPGRVHFWTLVNGKWEFQFTLAADDSASGDRFGESISLSSERLVVGAPRHDFGGTDKGAAYIYKRSGADWTFETKLTNPAETTQFGRTVSLSPDESYLGIGASGGFSVYRASGTDWVFAGRNGGGNFFINWESPAGTVRNYLYGYTNAVPEFATQRGNQTLVKFRETVSLLQLGTHEVTTRRQTNAQTTCIWIPTGFQGGARGSGPGISDQDNDGTSDLAEAYFGTYFDTYNTLSTGLQAAKPQGTALTIQWPRAPQDQFSVQAAAEWSADLNSPWTADGINVQKIGNEADTGRELMQATIPQSASSTGFFRLRFIAP